MGPGGWLALAGGLVTIVIAWLVLSARRAPSRRRRDSEGSEASIGYSGSGRSSRDKDGGRDNDGGDNSSSDGGGGGGGD